jgi:spore maturation protein CgeB
MRYTASALRQLGHEVIPFYCSRLTVDRLTLPTRKGRELLNRLPGGGALAEGLRRRWLKRRDQRLLDLAQRSRPDFTLILRGETLSRQLLEALKGRGCGPLFTWWQDNPFRFPIEDRLPLFDRFFVFDRSYVSALRSAGAKAVDYLPCACDETVYRPVRLSRSQSRRLRSEVAWVAWHVPGRERLVRGLQEFDLKVWGRGWGHPSVQASLNGARRRVVAPERYIPDRIVAQIYSAARIGLNLHNEQTRVAGLNARAFEVLSCGTFELTDRIQGMEELLDPNQEVAAYGCVEEAREKTAYYLRHPEEAQRMAQLGRRRVLGEHTYLHRMRTLLAAFKP